MTTTPTDCMPGWPELVRPDDRVSRAELSQAVTALSLAAYGDPLVITEAQSRAFAMALRCLLVFQANQRPNLRSVHEALKLAVPSVANLANVPICAPVLGLVWSSATGRLYPHPPPAATAGDVPVGVAVLVQERGRPGIWCGPQLSVGDGRFRQAGSAPQPVEPTRPVWPFLLGRPLESRTGCWNDGPCWHTWAPQGPARLDPDTLCRGRWYGVLRPAKVAPPNTWAAVQYLGWRQGMSGRRYRFRGPLGGVVSAYFPKLAALESVMPPSLTLG